MKGHIYSVTIPNKLDEFLLLTGNQTLERDVHDFLIVATQFHSPPLLLPPPPPSTFDIALTTTWRENSRYFEIMALSPWMQLVARAAEGRENMWKELTTRAKKNSNLFPQHWDVNRWRGRACARDPQSIREDALLHKDSPASGAPSPPTTITSNNTHKQTRTTLQSQNFKYCGRVSKWTVAIGISIFENNFHTLYFQSYYRPRYILTSIKKSTLEPNEVIRTIQNYLFPLHLRII